MPNRCTICNYLTKDEDNLTCETRKNCNFERVAVIHCVSCNGEYQLVGTGQVSLGENDKKPTSEHKAHCSLYLLGSMATDYIGAVTCLDCLATIPKEEQ